MGIAQQLEYNEFCSNCGDWVDKLNPFSGFCNKCSSIKVCESCGEAYVAAPHKLCKPCRNTRWLRRNADSIERVMAVKRVDAITAIQIVHDDNRPRCAMCGDKIRHRTKGLTTFCKKRDTCRRASIRYHHYRTRNKMSDDDALERALHGKVVK